MRAKIKTNVFLIFFYNLIFSYTDLEELNVFFRYVDTNYS